MSVSVKFPRNIGPKSLALRLSSGKRVPLIIQGDKASVPADATLTESEAAEARRLLSLGRVEVKW